MNVAVSLLISFLTALRGSLSAVPPAVCFKQFKWEDCGMAPQTVTYYYKSGSSCEVGFWRGCLPNPNMFANEYECVQTCILAPRAKSEHYHHFYDKIEDEAAATAVQTTTIEPNTTITMRDPERNPQRNGYTYYCLKEYICDVKFKEYFRVDDDWVHIVYINLTSEYYLNLHFAMKGRKRFILLLASSDLKLKFEIGFAQTGIVLYKNGKVIGTKSQQFFSPNILTAVAIYIRDTLLEVNLENPHQFGSWIGSNKQWLYQDKDFHKVTYFSFASGKKGESVFFDCPCFRRLPEKKRLLYLKQGKNDDLNGDMS